MTVWVDHTAAYTALRVTTHTANSVEKNTIILIQRVFQNMNTNSRIYYDDIITRLVILCYPLKHASQQNTKKKNIYT